MDILSTMNMRITLTRYNLVRSQVVNHRQIDQTKRILALTRTHNSLLLPFRSMHITEALRSRQLMLGSPMTSNNKALPHELFMYPRGE